MLLRTLSNKIIHIANFFGVGAERRWFYHGISNTAKTRIFGRLGFERSEKAKPPEYALFSVYMGGAVITAVENTNDRRTMATK